MIDLYEKRLVVYKLINKAKIPVDIKDEVFQEFAVYFYSNYNYDSTYKESSYIYLLFSNFLAAKAIDFKNKDSLMRKASRIDGKRLDWLDWVQEQNDEGNPTTHPEMEAYVGELMPRFTLLTQEYLLEKMDGKLYDNDKDEGVIRRYARETGVSRQAVEQRIKRDIKKVLTKLQGKNDGK